jgi:hypothetical protein
MTMGIPLLHPWANRLSGFEYHVADKHVVLPQAAACFRSIGRSPDVVAKRPLAAGSGTGDRLGAVRRADGRLQVTYAGHPLYYYVGDRRPGQVLCQAVVEFGGTWYVVAPNGQAIR